MMARTVCLCLLLATTSLLAPSAAAADWDETVEATAVSMEGDATLEGGLRAVALNASLSDDGKNHALRLEAEMFTVETVNSKRTVAVAVADETDRWVDNATHYDAELRGRTPEAGHRFFLASLDGQAEAEFTAKFESGTVSPAGDGQVHDSQMFNQDRPGEARGQQDAVRLTPEGEVPWITVTGAFQFSMWSWDAVVLDGAESMDYPSGEEQEYVVDPPEVRGVGQSHLRQVYVTVQNGTLTLGPETVSKTDIIMTPETASNTGVTRFYGTEGLTGALGSQGEADLRTDGAVRMSSFHVDDRLRAHVEGDWASQETGGSDLQSLVDPLLSPGVLAVVVMALLAAGLGTAFFLLGSPTATYKDLEDAFNGGRYVYVVRNTDRFLRHPSLSRDAAKMKAIALLALRRPQSAARFLASLDPSQRPDPTVMSFLRRIVERRPAPMDQAPDPDIPAHLARN